MSPSRLALHWQIFIGMIAGAVIGISLNLLASSQTTRVADGLPNGFTAMEIVDTSGRAEIRLFQDNEVVRELVIDPTSAGEDRFRSIDQLKAKEPEIAKLYTAHGGSWAQTIGGAFKRLGNLFLRMLQMVAVPLIVTSLITGVMGLSGHAVGRMFSRTLFYYISTSMLAIITGLVAVNLIRPGLRGGIQVAGGNAGGKVLNDAPPLGEIIFNQVEAMIPSNPLGALVEPNFLSIIAFTIAFSIFALRIGGTTATRVQEAANTAFAVIMAMTTAIIRLAPIGVFFLMGYVTSTQGIAVFQSLGWYVIAVALALAFHAMVTLPLILKYVAKRNPRQFAQAMSPALLTAFSSASSNGTLPLTMSCVEDRAGISNRTGSFVLPLGATINMDGTALYEAVAVMFIAQLHFGANLPLSQQVVIALTALLASVGAAGIPHAGLVMMVIILQAVNLPIELQGIILAVDRVLDMARTSVNVWSDACGCAVIETLEDRTKTGLPNADSVA
ncbi:MAG TPA: dicarboxylate/amino acid:cation symporter [Planctomycetaceae bacterium]|nr:dicarboxylate/amino acid:cation symporter [Planctomycetaceae bacterium]